MTVFYILMALLAVVTIVYIAMLFFPDRPKSGGKITPPEDTDYKVLRKELKKSKSQKERLKAMMDYIEKQKDE